MVGSDTWYPPATSYAGGGLDRDTGQNIPAALWDRVVSDILFNYTRRVVPLTNKSGGGVVAGDVVVVDTATNSSFTTTTVADNQAVLGVAFETIASNAVGQIVIGGLATVNVNGTTTRGQRLSSSTTVKLAKPSSVIGPADFATAVTAVVGAGAVTALIHGPATGGGAMQLIADVDLNGLATYTFASIPQVFRNLLLVGHGRTATAVTAESINLRPNNDTGGNYYYEQDFGNDATPGASASVAATSFAGFSMLGSTGVAGGASGGQVLIPGYRDTTFHKPLLAQWTSPLSNIAAGQLSGTRGGRWSSTAAISSLVILTNGGGNWGNGSRAQLYGLY